MPASLEKRFAQVRRQEGGSLAQRRGSLAVGKSYKNVNLNNKKNKDGPLRTLEEWEGAGDLYWYPDDFMMFD